MSVVSYLFLTIAHQTLFNALSELFMPEKENGTSTSAAGPSASAAKAPAVAESSETTPEVKNEGKKEEGKKEEDPKANSGSEPGGQGRQCHLLSNLTG